MLIFVNFVIFINSKFKKSEISLLLYTSLGFCLSIRLRFFLFPCLLPFPFLLYFKRSLIHIFIRVQKLFTNLLILFCITIVSLLLLFLWFSFRLLIFCCLLRLLFLFSCLLPFPFLLNFKRSFIHIFIWVQKLVANLLILFCVSVISFFFCFWFFFFFIIGFAILTFLCLVFFFPSLFPFPFLLYF